jgi:3',5'-cyclic-AMP phosphodiesterase
MMNTVHIAQISDTHLFADTHTRMMGINTWETFTAVMSLVQKSPDPIDNIIFSGDLCQDEKQESYQLLAKVMKKYAYPYYWIAGNHDHLDSMKHALTNTLCSSQKIINTPYWRIILINSNVPGKPEGHLTEHELSWIKQSCQEATQDHIMLCLHHHLLPIGCAWLDPLGVDNASALLDIIYHEKKIKLVTFGHIHQVFETTFKNVRYLSVPSTCFQFKPNSHDFAIDRLPPGYRSLALHADGSFTTKVHRCQYVPAGLTDQSRGY